jgi:hypothetical protein
MNRRALVLTNESARHPLRRRLPQPTAADLDVKPEWVWWRQFLLGWAAGFIVISFFIW